MEMKDTEKFTQMLKVTWTSDLADDHQMATDYQSMVKS